MTPQQLDHRKRVLAHLEQQAMSTELEKATRALEKGIQALLLGWVSKTGCEIESVRVDTRNFANLHVEVTTRNKP